MVDHRLLLQDAEKENQLLNIKCGDLSERPSLNMRHNLNLATFCDERIVQITVKICLQLPESCLFINNS
jgi:hypothetical protein